MEHEILPRKLNKKGESDVQYLLKIISVLSNVVSAGIKQTLEHYLGKVNVADEDKGYIKMKNEFHYSRLIVTYAKKSYVGLLMRQESHVYDKPKIDVKGVNFFKSTASDKTSQFIYQDVLMGQLLAPKNGKLSLKSVYKTIYDFQTEITDEIRSGEMGFLKRSIKVKSADAYVDPMRIGVYKGAWIWNYVNPEHPIELPATTTQVKVVLRNKKDCAKLERWPKIYNKFMELFENNVDIGDHMEIDPKTGKEKLVKGKGIKSICMPDDIEEVPDWLLAIIDVDTLLTDNMALFAQLFKPLGLVPGGASVNGTNQKYYTNIVRI